MRKDGTTTNGKIVNVYTHEGLNRVEVKFMSKEEMDLYSKEPWMGEEITFSPLAFDKDLCKLNREEFLKELKKYL